MDTNSRPNGAAAYTERDVIGLLDDHGGRLYWYFWLMLGDDTAVTRALTSTTIVALPEPGHRELYGTARTACRQYPPAPAMPYARAQAPTLAAATRAALRRLDPAAREVCVLGAPAYRLNDDDLGAVFETWEIEDLLSRPMSAFADALAACVADAGLEQHEDLVTRAWRLVGTGQVALPYDEIVPLATDPGAEWMREGIRARLGATTRAVQASHGGMELLGTGPQQAVTVQGVPDHLAVPLPRVPRKADQQGSKRRGAMAGTALVAGAIPVAFAVAWAGHSTQPAAQHLASPPLHVTAPGAPASSGAHAAPAGGHQGKSNAYAPRHARTGSGAQSAAGSAAGAGSTYANTASDMTGSGSGSGSTAGTTSTGTTGTGTTTTGTTTTGTTGTTTTGTTTTGTGTTTTGTTTTTPPPTTTTTTTTTGTGNANGNGGVGNLNGNGNFNGNGNGGVGNVNGNNGNPTSNNGNGIG